MAVIWREDFAKFTKVMNINAFLLKWEFVTETQGSIERFQTPGGLSVDEATRRHTEDVTWISHK